MMAERFSAFSSRSRPGRIHPHLRASIDGRADFAEPFVNEEGVAAFQVEKGHPSILQLPDHRQQEVQGNIPAQIKFLIAMLAGIAASRRQRDEHGHAGQGTVERLELVAGVVERGSGKARQIQIQPGAAIAAHELVMVQFGKKKEQAAQQQREPAWAQGAQFRQVMEQDGGFQTRQKERAPPSMDG
jgi:hypothetical protein